LVWDFSPNCKTARQNAQEIDRLEPVSFQLFRHRRMQVLLSRSELAGKHRPYDPDALADEIELEQRALSSGW
jgi:hypothetical protein